VKSLSGATHGARNELSRPERQGQKKGRRAPSKEKRTDSNYCVPIATETHPAQVNEKEKPVQGEKKLLRRKACGSLEKKRGGG